MYHWFPSSLAKFHIGLLIQTAFLGLSSLSLMGQGPSVKGSFPRDGSTGLLRNVFVSAGIELPNEVGVDLTTLNDSTVRMYPSAQPDSLVTAFVTADTDVRNITFEPVELLKANTTYTFEITSRVADESGAQFQPYAISFTTGEKALKKYISMNKTRLAPEEPPAAIVYASNDSLVGRDLGRLVEVTTGEMMLDDELVADVGEHTAAGVAEEGGEEEGVAEKSASTAPQPASAEAEATATPSQPTDAPTGAEDAAAEASSDEAPSEEEAGKNSPIFFPEKRIPQDGKLPIEFHLAQRQQVRLQVRTKSGKVIKRRGGYVDGGNQKIAISLRDIPPGVYMIYLIAGNHKAQHAILIE